MGRAGRSIGGGAVFVATRDGDLEVYADAARAAGHMEVVDVEDGEYASAHRVDGAVLAILVQGKRVELVATGEVAEVGLHALIEDHARRPPSAPGGATPLDVAEAWLVWQWEHRWPRWPAWLDRRLHGSGPPGREELAAPPGGPGPGLVRPQRLREVVDEVIAALPPGAVSITEGTEHGQEILHLRPRAHGAVDVLLVHHLMGVDVVVADSSPIEITAPYNINCGPPELAWDEDVHEVLHATSRGQVLIGEDAGRVVMVDVPGHRLGANTSLRGRVRTRRPAAWD